MVKRYIPVLLLTKLVSLKCVSVCDTLKSKRTDPFAMELYERTKALCHTHSIPEPGARTRYKQREMENFVLEATTGSHTELNNSDTSKRELFFPCVIRTVGEHTQRFSCVDAGLLKGIQACSPKCENFLSESHLNELAKHYSTDLKPEVARNFLALIMGWMFTRRYFVCAQNIMNIMKHLSV